MKNVLFIVSLSLLFWQAKAQDNISVKGTKITKKSIYMLIDTITGSTPPAIMYFELDDNPDSREPVGSQHTFSLKHNYSNIYFKWLNPIRYKITWKDTTLNDDRDVKLNEFFKVFAAQFGKDISIKSEGQDFRLKGASETTANLLKIPTTINDPELALMYLILAEKVSALDSTERKAINKITENLIPIDDQLSKNFTKTINIQLRTLYNIDSPDQVTDSIETVNTELNRIKQGISGAQDNQKIILGLLSTLKVRDVNKNLQTYLNGTINSFFKKSDQKFIEVKDLIAKFDPLKSILLRSVARSRKSDKDKATDYFKVRDVSFQNGKVLQTLATITEFELKSNTLEKKADIAKSTFTFRRFDYFDITVGPGIFYGSTSIPGYGIKNKGSDFEVTADTIKKSTPVPALLANFHFGLGSKLLGFHLQVGAAPAKNRPFALLGGGISFPNAKFAISAGGLWTFVPTLNKLSPGSTIKESTELEKDITYNFQIKPIGWYLGLQYNF